MAELCNLKVGAKVASWPYFGHIFWIMDFKFVLPTIHINIKGEAQLEVNWTQMDHFILKNGQKWPYLHSRLRNLVELHLF